MSLDFNSRQMVDLPQKPLPIVSIGMGGIVHDSHYPAYRKAGFPVVGGYDLNPEQARKLAGEFGVPAVYESLTEAITQAPPDAVFDVAVPGNVVIGVLEQIPNNRVVLIQKP